MEAKDLGQLSALITQNGFASLMCIWFMWRMEKRFERMTIIMTMMAERLKVNPTSKDEDNG